MKQRNESSSAEEDNFDNARLLNDRIKNKIINQLVGSKFESVIIEGNHMREKMITKKYCFFIVHSQLFVGISSNFSRFGLYFKCKNLKN